ncbi:hypothetical protein Q4490_12335 [Neptunomonas phycophila]|uniref:Uncharacterized protein n=1 Tax=Neptunomonas phycophila TaxID=1572645 RepID=A0AAW7XLU6_9GAMM|nr:hypothetical protein [Neptunomonas phycophila]MDO6454353.1 hypothetical protein [Neptunomonas phycophila]
MQKYIAGVVLGVALPVVSAHAGFVDTLMSGKSLTTIAFPASAVSTTTILPSYIRNQGIANSFTGSLQFSPTLSLSFKLPPLGSSSGGGGGGSASPS